MFREMATFVFFVMTGYKFRPASNNPYFSVPTDDDMDEFGMGEVLIGGTAISEQERVTSDKKGCTIGLVNCFLRVPLVHLPCCKGKLGKSQTTVYKTIWTIY